jgi:predicted nucleotidyltransferase
MKDRLEPGERRAVSEFLDLLYQHHARRVMETALFGSKARGDSTPGSDIDILVIVDQEDWRLSHAISDLAADVSLEHDVLIAPRVIGQERWERMTELGFGLYKNIAAEGIPLSPVRAAS